MQVEISEDGFINLMRNQLGGALIDELDRELIKANQAVLDHGGKATITLKFSVARIKHLDAAMDIGHVSQLPPHPHHQRVIGEKAVLDKKATALSDFIGNSPIFEMLDPAEQERLKEQNDVMWQYSEILGKRIKAFR